MKRHGRAKAITTDGLRFCKAAMMELGNADKQEVGRWANNRAENSHLPFRRRERAMLRFRQMKTLQKFSAVQAAFHNYFNQDRHLISRETYKAQSSAAPVEWKTRGEQAPRPLPYLRPVETSCRWADHAPARLANLFDRGERWASLTPDTVVPGDLFSRIRALTAVRTE